MTTLNVDDEELVRAVSGFPTVASIAADASIPHKLTITVTERLPVAVFRSGGEATAVSIDGYLLPGVDVQGEGLPQIEGAEVSDGRLEAEGAAQAAIVGAAPDELRERIEAVELGLVQGRRRRGARGRARAALRGRRGRRSEVGGAGRGAARSRGRRCLPTSTSAFPSAPCSGG